MAPLCVAVVAGVTMLQSEGLSAQFAMMYACVAVLLGLLHMRESQRSFTEVAMEALRSCGRIKCCTRAGTNASMSREAQAP